MNRTLEPYDEFKPLRKPIEIAADLARTGGKLNVEAANCIKQLHDHGKPLLDSLCWALRQLQGDTGTGDSHWSQFPEYVAAVEVVRSLGGDVAHSKPVSVCDHYRHKALQVVIDWDGQSTGELFDEILHATGESETLLQLLREARVRWYHELHEPSEDAIALKDAVDAATKGHMRE